MRAIRRHTLSTKTLTFLVKRTAKVITHTDPAAEARRLWNFSDNAAFDDIRACLAAMAPGRSRCMYCEDSAGTDIEHFKPIARWPELAFTWENYLWACSHCNSNDKRDLFPIGSKGEALLLDPTIDDPSQHLGFMPATGDFDALTARGQCTIDIFGLNDDKPPRRLPTGRLDALTYFYALIISYKQAIDEGEIDWAKRCRDAVQTLAFSSIVDWAIRLAESEDADLVLPENVIVAMRLHDVRSWV